jgi:hypothetical protein
MEMIEQMTVTEAVSVEPWEMLSDEALAVLGSEPGQVGEMAVPESPKPSRRRGYGFARALYGGGGGARSPAAPFHVRA